MSTIDQMNNNCTLKAVREVTGLPDADIFQAFRAYGYKDNKGMMNSKWTAAARCLGVQLEEVTHYAQASRETTFGSYIYKKPMTLGEFIRENSVGVFLISVTGHALVLWNGRVIEYGRGVNKGLRRRMCTAHRVLNPVAKPEVARTEFLRINVWAAKNGSSKAALRWRTVWRYMYDNKDKNVTVQELLANTEYTMADFKHDLKKGFIEFKPVETTK